MRVQLGVLAGMLTFTAVLPPPAMRREGSVQTRPPYSANEPLVVPALFASGLVSTPDDELNACFTPDGRTLYFTKNHVGQRLGVIVESRFAYGRWNPPEVASFSGQYTDYDPFISPDGSKLFFVSNRPLTGTAKKDFDIWMVEKTANGWSAPKNLGEPINSRQDEYYPSVAADGTLYFSATRPDSKGRFDIYRATWRDGRYAEPENLGDGVNSTFNEIDNYIAPDQSFLVFASTGRPDDLGNGDLYISDQVEGRWTGARHLVAGINSSAREYCPIGSPDGKYFFFTSFRGFGDRTPEKAWTYKELQEGFRSVLNGWGNVYQVDMSVLRAAPPPPGPARLAPILP